MTLSLVISILHAAGLALHQIHLFIANRNLPIIEVTFSKSIEGVNSKCINTSLM